VQKALAPKTPILSSILKLPSNPILDTCSLPSQFISSYTANIPFILFIEIYIGKL